MIANSSLYELKLICISLLYSVVYKCTYATKLVNYF